jgi:extracellular matrix protein 14
MMAPSLRDFLLVSTLLSSALAVPTLDTLHTSPHAPASSLYSRDKQPAGLFRRVRDGIIERIWAVPGKSEPTGSLPGPNRAPENFHARYGGDVVLRFAVRTREEAKALAEATEILYLDVWEATEEWVDIRIAKDVVPSFVGLLPPSLRDAYKPLMHDLARAVYDTYPTKSEPLTSLTSSLTTTHDWTNIGPPQDLFFQDYQPLSVLYPWLRLIASLFPDHASLTSIGLSAEGRDIPALRIGARRNPSDDPHEARQTLVLVGGSHAREWISVSTTAYILYSLVTRYGHPQFPYVTKMLNHFDLVFIPVLNPDGYEYTWTTDRLWRKNRQGTSLAFCPGIDIDRAFAFEWDGHGSMDNACSDDYAGPGPLAAVEAQRLAEWARNETQSQRTKFVGFLDFHSYAQEVLYPYSYSCGAAPPNLEDLEEVALGLAKSFRLTNGHYYGVEGACRGSMPQESRGGSALDFFYHDMDVKLAYQIKLRDRGTYGFLLPKSQILPTGEESYEAVVGLGRWMLGNHGIERAEADGAEVDDAHAVWGAEDDADAVSKDSTNGRPETPEEDEPEWEYLNESDWELKRRRRRR